MQRFNLLLHLSCILSAIFIVFIDGHCPSQVFPGEFRQISTSVNYMWAIAPNNDIYNCNNPCTSNIWTQIPGKLTQINVGDEDVWGVNSTYNIFKRKADGSGNWQPIAGKLKHVSASGNGYIWGVSATDFIYKCKKPCNGDWITVSGRLKQIDGDHAYVYGVNSANNLYFQPVDGSGAWRHIPGMRLKYVSAGGKDDIHGLTANGALVRCRKPCIGEWVEESSGVQLVNCDASINQVVGVTSGNLAMKLL